MIDVGRIVDFHSHILPGVDHGSDSLATTLFQLDSAKKHGINKIVSTSHFYPTVHTVDGFLKKRDFSFSSLLAGNYDIPDIRLGAEVLLCNGIDHLEGIEKLCIRGTNTLLLELPFSGYSREYTYTVERLLGNGFNVVLAHADRYERSIIQSLLPLGVKLQLNASSLVGFNKLKNRYLFDWANRGLVVALGSDIHGKDAKAYCRLCSAFCAVGTDSEQILRASQRIWAQSLLYQ